ncbi:uncharacterized protein LOC142344329 [Convolutriloba macropyga]|uniref:uncharacterized protein LOC142344329 n=1 Tax=Convolutriloba macropyga TaxID=536237 RepID=UPI003F51D666
MSLSNHDYSSIPDEKTDTTLVGPKLSGGNPIMAVVDSLPWNNPAVSSSSSSYPLSTKTSSTLPLFGTSSAITLPMKQTVLCSSSPTTTAAMSLLIPPAPLVGCAPPGVTGLDNSGHCQSNDVFKQGRVISTTKRQQVQTCDPVAIAGYQMPKAT